MAITWVNDQLIQGTGFQNGARTVVAIESLCYAPIQDYCIQRCEGVAAIFIFHEQWIENDIQSYSPGCEHVTQATEQH